MRKSICVGSLAWAVLSSAAAPGSAAPVTFDLDTVFTGATPAGAGAWIIATFAQTGVNEVTLTMDVQPLSQANPNAFVSDWYFNVAAPHEDHLDGLAIAHVGGTKAKSVHKDKNDEETVSRRFDLRFEYWTSSSKDRLNNGESSVYKFTASGISPEWFNVLSGVKNGQDKSPFYTAAHIQGLANGQSSKVTGDERGQTIVPLPSTAALSFAGLAIVAGRRRRP